MHHYITILSIAIILYMICAWVSKHFQERKYASKAKRLGCQSLLAPSRKWLFGVDRIYQNIRANKADLLLELIHERYRAVNSNTYTYSLFGNKVIATAEPQNIQAILATQFDDFCLGALRRDCFMPLLGNGIFTQDGEAWKHSRAILRPQFSRGKVTDLEMEERHVQDMMSALPVDKGGWTLETDLQLLFFRYALDSTCEAILGDSPGSQVANVPKNSSSLTADMKDEEVFAAAFDTSQAWLAYRARALTLYWLSDGPEFRRACETVHDFIDSLVCKALDKWSDKRIQQANLDNQAMREKSCNEEKTTDDKIEQSQHHNKPKYTFLHALIAEDVDRKEIRFQLLHILLAGRDTTGKPAHVEATGREMLINQSLFPGMDLLSACPATIMPLR